MSNLYKNLVLSQDEYLEKRKYWLDKLSGDLEKLNLPYDYKKIKNDIEYLTTTINFDSKTSFNLLNMSKNKNLSLFVLLTTLVKTLLYRYTGNEDISLCSPTINIGSEITYNDRIILKDNINGSKSFKDLLIKVKDTTLAACENQDYPIEMILDQLEIENISNVVKVGIIMNNLQSTKFNEEKFDILFCFTHESEVIKGELIYNKYLFNKSKILQMAEHLKNIAASVIEDINIKIKNIDMLNKDEKSNYLLKLNNTEKKYSQNFSIKKMFEKQVLNAKNKTAVVFQDKNITYFELNSKSNSLARKLKNTMCEKNPIIGIMLEPSIEMIIAILGVIKSGVAYLPLNPDISKERLDYILKDSKVETVLSTKTTTNFNNLFNDDIDVMDLLDKDIYSEDDTNLKVDDSLSNLIYVIYTSGTTGKPKGVMLENKNLVNYVNWFSNKASLKQNDKTMLISSYSFDLGYTALYSSLLNGCELHLLTKESYSDPNYLINYIIENNITYLKLTPSLFNIIINVAISRTKKQFKHIKLIVLGGEPIVCEDVEKFHEINKDTIFLNHYGPTETTIGSIAHEINFDEIEYYKKETLIGRPIDNTQIYILDKDLNLLPKNTPGEIYISGNGLSRGYLNNSSLTENKFISNPFLENKKMYKTGDLGQLTDSVSIKFLGRADHQVKIRGYRVETSGIENIMLKHKDINEVLVVALDDSNNNKYLCGYIVANEINLSELREFILKYLPDYMIPTYFMKLDKMPLTPNGKINRKALPLPDGNIETGSEYVKPVTDIEKAMVSVWKEVLKVKQVGINDDFFILGGDSIKAIQVASRLFNQGIKLEIKDLLQYPTVEELSKLVDNDSIAIDQSTVTGNIMLTPIQKRFYEFDFANKYHWNQSVMLFRSKGFSEDIIKVVFKKIIEKHDALRMVYTNESCDIKQFNRDIEGELFSICVKHLRNRDDYKQQIFSSSTKIQESINLETGPLVKLGLFKTNEGDHLLIAVHHLVIDGVSWRIIFEDFAKAYIQVENNLKITLPKKTTSFMDWSKKLHEYSQSETLLNELNYWESVDNVSGFNLKKDFTHNSVCTHEKTSNEVLQFNQEETNLILKKVHLAYNTEINDILISALGIALKDMILSEKLLLNLEGHGRENISDDIDVNRTIGWFTSIYPVLVNLKNSSNLKYFIKETKEILRKIPKKGIGYGILRYVTAQNNKNIKLCCKPEICFNYLGQFDGELDNQIFELSKLGTGSTVSKQSQRQYSLQINGIVKNNCLEIDFGYNSDEFSQNTVEDLMSKYKNAMLAIINHCTSTKNMELTPSDFTYSDLSIEDLDIIKNKHSNTESGKEIKDICALSPMQKVMFYNTNFDKGISPYMHYRSFTVNHNLDINIIEKSFNIILNKYDILRTVFEQYNEQKLIQITYKNVYEKIYYKDISDMDKKFQKSYVEDFIKKDLVRGFRLNAECLMRISILKTGEYEYEAIWTNHHLILDGWSRMIILKDFLNTISLLKNNKTIEIPKQQIYSQYIKWIEKRNWKESYEYWSNFLKDYNEQEILPKSITALEDINYLQKDTDRFIDEKTTSKLNEYAVKNQLTLNTVFQGIWGILLQKINNVQDVVFGSAVSGRISEIKNVESIVGPMINVIPIRVKTYIQKSFVSLIKELHNCSLESEKYSYEAIDRNSEYKFSKNLIDSAIFYENYPIEDSIKHLYDSDESRFSNIKFYDQLHTSLNLFVIPFETTAIKLTYNSLCFDDRTIENIADNIIYIIDQLLDNINNIDEIKII